MPHRSRKRFSFRRLGFRVAKCDQLWCPDCSVRIYTPGARLRALREIQCRVCGERFENPVYEG